jgi:hypothetical protein
MAPDEIYQPIVSDADEESETPSPQAELQIEDPAQFRSRLEEGIDKSDLTTEEAVSQRRRRPDPESPESAYERPIVKHVVKGHGPITLNEAADATRWARGYKLGQELATSGLSQSQVEAMAADAVARGERIDPLAPPPPEVKGLDEFGRVDDGPINVEEGAKQLSEWRQRHAEAQQAELQELAGEAVQHAQAEAQAQQPQPEPQPQLQAQQTPEQTERQKIAAERQQITHLKRMEGIEASWRHSYDLLKAQVAAEFPGLPQATAADVEQLKIQDPARFQRLAQYDAALKDRQQRIAALTQQRVQHEQQQAQAASAERAAARAEQDAAFERLAAQHIPNWERNHAEVRAQARQTLQNAGLTPEQLHYLWNGDHSIDVHSSVLQLVLAKAAQWDLAQQRAHQVRQAPVPPVQKPGAYRARDDGAQSVHELSARLSRASGREAIRLATELQRAKRARD